MTIAETWRSRLMTLHGALLRGRRAAGMTQQQLADRLGVDRRTVQRWEDGSCDPSSQDLFRWADALGLAVFSAPADGCGTSAASEPVAHQTSAAIEASAGPTARRALPLARHLCRSTALSTTEQARAYHLLVVEGRSHAAVAATLTAERAHGAAPVSEEDVRVLYRAERSLHFRDRFHGLPRVSLDGENAATTAGVHVNSAAFRSRGVR